MNYQQLEDYLFSISDPKFASFSKSLSNSDYISIGVKNPVLRQIIKDHKNDDELKTDEFNLGKYLEVDFIYFGLSLVRLSSVDDQLCFLLDNVSKAKSWAITDTLSTYLKRVSFSQFESFFLKAYLSKETYKRRMAYILGLKQYKDKNITKILKYIQFNEEYIVMMSEAWLLSVVALTYENEVFDFLKTCPDLVLKRKTISKINESFRFDKSSKERFKSLR